MLAEIFTPEQITILTQIIFIDLVLAGDNAIIIGMVASKFPANQRKLIIFWGIGGAVVLRIILTLMTAYLLQISGLRLIGGLLLLYIVYKLYTDVIKGESKGEDIKVDNSGFFKAIIEVNLDLINQTNAKVIKRQFIEEITYDSMENKFELNQYKNKLEKNMVFKIIQDIGVFFSVIQNDM